jgi:hypothetical protein
MPAEERVVRYGERDTLHRIKGAATRCGLPLSRPTAEVVRGNSIRAHEMCRRCFSGDEVRQAAEREEQLHETTYSILRSLLGQATPSS